MLDATLTYIFTRWIRARAHPMKIRLLRYFANATGNRLLTVPYLDNTYLRVQPLDYIGYKVIESGTYEPAIYELLRSSLSSADVYVDVGSHVGCFALPMARRCKSVYAIDANPNMVRTLTETARLNRLSNLECFNVAISDSEGTAEFFIASSGNTGTSSLHSSWPHGSSVERVQVPCTTLANWVDRHAIERIDCLKIDAEGATGRVLVGAEPILERIGLIIAEDSPDIGLALELLREHRFALSYPFADVADSETNGTLVAANPVR